MTYSITYKGAEYRCTAADFPAARAELEEIIGRPLPHGTAILAADGETTTIKWGVAV